MSILKKLLLKYNIQDSDVIDVSKPPNFREANHAKTSFDRAYYENVHQIDTLYLPTDKSGYKYLLVCIDIGSGLTDVRAMKNLNGETSLKCLKNIYGLDNKKQNDVFKKTPISIHADKGTEFNNNLVINFFHDKNIGLRFSATGRHSQQAVVERMNRTIGETINKLQLHNENITGEEYTDWIDFLPDIIEAVNEHAKETKKPLPFKNDNADVRCNGTECEIYETGTKVRIALDYPTDVNGKRIYGKFRAGDRRFSLKPYIIENVLMFPNQPIRYVIQGVKNNTFSKAELLPYIAPKTKQLSDGKFVIEKIIDQKKVGNRIFYLVKWEGYDDDQNTWEPRTELIKDNALPSIQQFLSNQKKK